MGGSRCNDRALIIAQPGLEGAQVEQVIAIGNKARTRMICMGVVLGHPQTAQNMATSLIVLRGFRRCCSILPAGGG